MKWTKLYIKNFLSIQEAEIDLSNRGLVLIEGKNTTNSAYKSNGAGKSTVFDSIIYALYDTTSKGLKADDIINRVEKKNTSVILEGEKDGNTYRIERYRKHSKNKNKVRLFQNGKEISEKSVKDTNAKIEQIIGIDYKTFMNSIMFSQGSGTAGKFSTATDREKKEILENVVNLSIYAKAQDVAKERIKKKDKEIEENKRATERLEWELENVDKLEQQDKENYQQTKKLIDSETANLDNTINEFTRFVEDSIQTLNQVEEAIERLEKEVKDYSNIDISDITQKVNEKFQEIKQKELNLQNLNNRKNEIVDQYKKVKNDTNCPVCGNPLDPVHRNIELQKLEQELRQVLINTQQLTQEIESMKWDYHVLETEYNNKKELYDKANQGYQAKVQELNEYKQWKQNYESTKRNYKNKIQHIKDTLEKLKNVPEPRPRDEERRAIQDKIKSQKQALLALEQDKSKLEDVVKVFSNSGVKSHVLDLVTPFLNERANKYLSTLSGSSIEIEFSTQKQNKSGELTDKFDIRIDNTSGGESYQANSEGEKRRIDLAISLALQDLVLSKTDLKTNIIVYDEVFDALDEVGVENVITLLKERLDIVDSVFVITHSEHLKALFDKVITVEKIKDGISVVHGGMEEKTS